MAIIQVQEWDQQEWEEQPVSPEVIQTFADTVFASETGQGESDLTGRQFADFPRTQPADEVAIIQTVLQYKTLQKLRQLEKSVHFMERRSSRQT